MDWTHLYAGRVVYKQPIYISSSVVHGFKRGSKELGCPTANLDMDLLILKDTNSDSVGFQSVTGIYFGLAKLRDKVYDCVVSVGYNPGAINSTFVCLHTFFEIMINSRPNACFSTVYKNSTKTIECHIIYDKFLEDFYDETLSVLLFGYLRDECNFKSVDELVDCIRSDIRLAKEMLQTTTKENTTKYSDCANWSCFESI